MKFPIIRFGRWSSAHMKFMTYKRWYYKGWHWTPIVFVERRYKHA